MPNINVKEILNVSKSALVQHGSKADFETFSISLTFIFGIREFH